MTTRFGLAKNVIEQICTVLARYPQVDKAILYGSRAKGNFRNGSDIDLTLCGGVDLNLTVLGQIMNDLDDLLLPYTFDLSNFADISDLEVVDHIHRVGVIFYEKKSG